MRWSKLRKLVESRFAESLSGRLSIHSAAYGNCTCGHCWITLDKEVVANFCTRAYFNRKLHGASGQNSMYQRQLVLYGEKSRQGAYQSLFEFVHSLSIEEALESDDVLIQSLAVVDSRVGRRKLETLDADGYHPLAQALLIERRVAEGLSGAA